MSDPSLRVIALLTFAGFFAGLVDSIAGGGGLVTVPALLAAGLPPQVAIATNKGQACFGAVSSFWSFWSRGQIDRSRASAGFFFGLVGSFAGAFVLLGVRPEPLRPVVLVLLVIAAVVVAWPRRVPVGAQPKTYRRPWLVLAPVALGLGFYDGFFGPGVGSMLIVAFVLLFGDGLIRASGNAKVVNLASNLAALVLFSAKGAILWKIALPMAGANAAGAYVGSALAVKRGDRLVRAVVLAVVAALVVKLGVDLVR